MVSIDLPHVGVNDSRRGKQAPWVEQLCHRFSNL